MPNRRMRRRDRVIVGLRSLTPAVEDAQHERIGTRSGDHRKASKVQAIYICEISAGEVAFPHRIEARVVALGVESELICAAARPISAAKGTLFLGGVAAGTAAGIRSQLPAGLEVEILDDPIDRTRLP